MTRKCEHEVTMGQIMLPEGGWNGPVSRCSCCMAHFGYIDSASYGPAGGKGTTWTPHNLCSMCGGKYETWDTTKAMTSQAAR